MVTKRPTSWFLTEKGRKFSFALMTGTGIALTTVKFAPHTFFIDKYKDFVQYYRSVNFLSFILIKDRFTYESFV